MTSTKDIQAENKICQAFLDDLQVLLKKHNASIRAESFGSDMIIYGTMLNDGRDVFIAEEFDSNYITIQEGTFND